MAQGTLLQAGPTTQGHTPSYANQGGSGSQAVVQDSGPAGGGGAGLGLSELNLTARGTGSAPYVGQGTGPLGTVFCVQDGPTAAPAGYHYLCFSANVSSGGLITYGNGGVAAQQPLNFNINGSSYVFPGSFGLLAANNVWTGTNTFNGAVTATAGATFNTTGVTFSSGITSTGTNSWGGVNSFAKSDFVLLGTSTGGLTLNAGNTGSGSNTITLPAGTTDFSATGGTSQVVKQTSSGGAFTVAQLANTDITGLGTASTANTGTSGATIPFLNGVNTWSGVQTFSAALAFSTTNTIDIGTSATVLAPRTVYAGTSFVGPVGTFTTSATIGAGSAITSSGAGGALGTAAFVATGTSGATIPLLNGINTWSGATNTFSGMIVSSAGLPTIASGACGTTTNGAVVAGSTDQTGSITIGSAGTSTCTVSFSATLGAAPKACIIQPANATAAATGTTAAYISSITTAQFVITGTLANANYYYHCL
jgi:hypothetical protein